VGILSNAANLLAILDWYAGFWEEGDDGVDI
jgi:hypothetical protein